MSPDRGFSLLEVLIAMTIVVVALGALAPLLAIAIHANTTAKTLTIATLLAAGKMEELRSLTWGFDALGVPTADPRLTASPAGALQRNTRGFCDFVDEHGGVVGEGTTPPPGAVYLRRWSIEPLPFDPANALVLQVLVTERFNRRIEVGVAHTQPDEARLVTVRTRKGL